ncbi:hypothetical protein B5E56_00385 [Flavonifractor sp. An112]|uniref:RNA-directed DNA polymerase n=1 Tax=Flavonifractor sp. An112 TaxID=1965544 RepID=UPI000B375A05|nr:RNA-directed DNA polymerase [Flavonifractor sp. An112]OUQ61772.1 hypothetical protein B5E56_00385 [Flavonifractor sp. An112]
MFNTENLLRNEVFPAELPPCFSTDDLATNASFAIATSNSFGQNHSIPLTYSGYKSESSRRKFALPNPYHYCKAVDFIVNNESQIKAIFEKSKYSLTAPIDRQPRQEQAYAKRSNTVLDTKREIECLFQENRYEIRLDINAFFDNIYTHCIPWAIHGITVAKKHRNDMTLLGNQLDKLMRALNYDQTNGILVGNAVSRIVSEIILCTIDEQISKKFPEISCCRFVDDYYIYISNSSQIQEIISYIRTCLTQYELSFNENKIRITEGPFLYGNPWVEEIKQYIHLQPDVFLTKLIIEYNKSKDLAILKYGLKVISCYHYTKNNWPAMQSRLINLWTHFPSLSDRIIDIFLNNKDLLKINALKRAIYSVIDESILLNKEQELIWAVWFVKIFNISISQVYITKVLKTTNELAIIIMLDIVHSSNLENVASILQQRRNLHNYLKSEDTNEKGIPNSLMWTAHWLLAYESTKNQWLKLPGIPFEYAKKNQFFNELLNRNVKFYDPNFSYPNSSSKFHNHEFATRSELYNALRKMKKSILENLKGTDVETSSSFTPLEEDLFRKFIEALQADETIY